MENLEEFKKDTEETIKENPDGALIYDISLRYGSIETDIISYAEYYGFDPEWTEEQRKIIEESNNADNALYESGLEWLNEVSDGAESYLNDLLQKADIDGWSFARISESEIWGLWPDSIFNEDADDEN